MDQQGNGLGRQLGRNVSHVRRLQKLTQAGLAEKIGVDAETVSRIERGVVLPSLATLERIAIALDVALVDLLQEVSTAPIAEARLIEGWLRNLTEHDRAVVVDVIRVLCRRFGVAA